MNEAETSAPPLPPVGNAIRTACNSETLMTENTPRALYRGRWVFFCEHVCQAEFEQDPLNSCLTSHTLGE